jgi:hypothetical protein
MLIYHYGTYYPDPDNLAAAKTSYTISTNVAGAFGNQSNPKCQGAALSWLKSQLGSMGLKIPTLYKQYSDLTTQGGTRFCAFNIDKDFGNCIDGLVIVDIDKLKSKKRERYIQINNLQRSDIF